MDGGLWHCTRGRNQDNPQEKEMQKGQMVFEEALQIAEKRREAKGKGEKEIYPFECRVPKNSEERQESLPQWSVQRNRKTVEWERLEISSKKLEIPREHFMQSWAQ